MTISPLAVINGILEGKNNEEYENKNTGNVIDEKTSFIILEIIKKLYGTKDGLAKFRKLFESYSGFY